MGRIPEAVIDEVLRRADILETVQTYVSLKKAGANFKGLCPFHSEKTPSFNVHPGKGIYKCFGCGEGGNVLGFLMKLEGWNFPEAVRYLAEKHNIEIPEESDEDREAARRRREGKKLYIEIMETARSFFEASLWGQEGRAARHYLTERGIGEQTAKAFGLGYAPQGWQNLLDHMATKGFDARWVERAGLALQRNKGDGHYDRFRHRIIFPIVDIWNHTLAFGGRVFASDDDSPKYINSPETTFYTKGEQLYGLWVAKQAIQQTEEAVLVEGNFDVIALHAHGVENVVAPMGTALTPVQAKLLSRYCRRVVVAFDGDSAGEEASLRCLAALEDAGVEARVVRFDETDDPDTFVRRRGVDALQAKIADSRNLVDWALDRVLPAAERGDVQKNVHALEEAGELLREVRSDVAREHYVAEIARRLAIEPRLVKEYIKRPDALSERVREAVTASHQQPMRLEKAEEGLLVVLLDHDEWLEDFLAEEYDKLLCSEELATFLHRADEHRRERGQLEAPILLEQIQHPAFRATVQDALLRPEAPYLEDKARQWYDDCVRQLKLQWAERTIRQLQADLDRLEFQQDPARWEETFRQKQKVEGFRESVRTSGSL